MAGAAVLMQMPRVLSAVLVLKMVVEPTRYLRWRSWVPELVPEPGPVWYPWPRR